MNILVSVKTRAKENKVMLLGGNSFRVFLKAIPSKGEANTLLIEVLANYFKVSKQQVFILAGFVSKLKRVRICSAPVLDIQAI